MIDVTSYPHLVFAAAARSTWAPEPDDDGCVSCGSAEDLSVPTHDEAPPLCLECRSPLRHLEFPEVYCDLGEGD